LHIGPLDATGTRHLDADSDGTTLGALVEQLADEHRVGAVGSREMLALHMIDRR
jgi:hypothetical protein